MLNSSLSHRNAPAAATETLKPTEKPSYSTSSASGPLQQSTKYINRRGPSLQWWLMAIPAFIVSTYALLFITTSLTLFDPAVKAKITSTIDGVTHISASLVALGVGPFQFLPELRRQYPSVHRILGFIYFAAVTTGSLSALAVTKRDMSYTHQFGRLGYLVEALMWFETLRRSFVSISLHQDVKTHQRWMTRNYAITYGAVMIRWQLPLMSLFGIPLAMGVALGAWVSWVPHLILVEYFIQKGKM